jgi:flagellar biosynthetic protein FliQ
MTPEIVVDLFRQAIFIIITILAILIIPGLIVGLIVSIFQAATQINEQTLSFLPRLLVTFLMLVLTGPWLLRMMIEFTESIFNQLPQIIA